MVNGNDIKNRIRAAREAEKEAYREYKNAWQIVGIPHRKVIGQIILSAEAAGYTKTQLKEFLGTSNHGTYLEYVRAAGDEEIIPLVPQDLPEQEVDEDESIEPIFDGEDRMRIGEYEFVKDEENEWIPVDESDSKAWRVLDEFDG